MKKIVILLTGLLIVLKLSGQDSFVTGYLVLNNHDTLHGFIQNDPNFILTQVVTFKISDQAHSIEYKPDQIIAFKFSDNKYFESHILKTGNDSSMNNFQCLVKGRVSLYVLNEKKRNRFFVSDSINDFHELFETFKKVQGGKRSNYEYVFTLKEIMEERIDFYPQIDKSKLNPSSLINLVSKYNTFLAQDQTEIFRSKYKILVTPVVYSGVSYRYSVVGNFGYLLGVNFYLSRPERSQKISFKGGIHYASNHFIDKAGEVDLLFPIDIVFKMGTHRASPGLYLGISPNLHSGKKFYSNKRYYNFYPYGFDIGINKAFFIKNKRRIFSDFRVNSLFIGLTLGYGF